MMVSNSGPDAASRAALRSLMERLPGMSAVEGGSIEPAMSSDPPLLRSAKIVEGSSLRVVKVPDFTRHTVSGFGAFLDGTQQVRLVAHHFGMPVVFGTVAAGVRIRVNRRLITWGHQPPRVERKIYLPLRYLPPLAEIRDASREMAAGTGRSSTPRPRTRMANIRASIPPCCRNGQPAPWIGSAIAWRIHWRKPGALARKRRSTSTAASAGASGSHRRRARSG